MKSNNERQQHCLLRSKISPILRNSMTGNFQQRPRLKKGGLFITALCMQKRDTGGLAKAENTGFLHLALLCLCSTSWKGELKSSPKSESSQQMLDMQVCLSESSVSWLPRDPTLHVMTVSSTNRIPLLRKAQQAQARVNSENEKI